MPTATVAAASHSIVTTGWTNPSNAFSATGDNVYATGTPGKNGTISGDFFPANITAATIPDGARIVQSTVTCEWYMSAAVNGGTLGVQQRRSGTALGSETTNTNKTSSAAEGDDTQAVTTPYGIADVRSASTVIAARVRVAQGNTSSAMTGNLDFVKYDIDWLPNTMACLGT